MVLPSFGRALMPRLRYMRPRLAATVFGPMDRAAATSRFVIRDAATAATHRSEGVSPRSSAGPSQARSALNGKRLIQATPDVKATSLSASS
jgi:hypothetical protein